MQKRKRNKRSQKISRARRIEDKPEKILVVIPVSRVDYVEAAQLLPWMIDLGGCKKNEGMLMLSADVPEEGRTYLQRMAGKVFKKVHVHQTPYCLPNESWPVGPNWMHLNAARWVQLNCRTPWFWLEPDCIPLSPNWIEAIEKDYHECLKPFMGFAEPAGNGYDSHISGCRVSPPDFFHRFGHVYNDMGRAFDLGDAENIMKKCHKTPLFHFEYGAKGTSPRFYTKDDIKRFPKKAVIYHRNKDGSLIGLLRKSK